MKLIVRLDVFGSRMDAEFDGTRWALFKAGSEGKRARVDVVIPAFIAADEVAQYLFDLWHESPRASNSSIRRLD